MAIAHHTHLPSRGRFLRWLRRTHGWIGLWGAVLGFVFGATGFLLNHRAIMKIPASHMEQTQIELALPATRPQNADELAKWLQSELQIQRNPAKVADEPAKNIVWGGQALTQPAHWKIDFQAPQQSYSAEYWVGNSFVTIKRQDANLFAFLTRLHKGTGMSAAWILLADTLAGAMMLLSVTGVLLWTKMRGSRLAMAGLTGTSLTLMLLYILQSM